jgi:hypothetical protein
VTVSVFRPLADEFERQTPWQATQRAAWEG